MNDQLEKLLNVITYVLGFAFLVIISVFLSKDDVVGEVDVLAFVGALLGGVITLIGVQFTIKSSFEGIKNQQIHQLTNEEEKRKIAQLNGLIRIRFELKKIITNFNILENVRETYIKNSDQTKGEDILNEEFDLRGHDLEALDVENWNKLDIDDHRLFYNLLEIKEFYSNFATALKPDVQELKFKIKDLGVEKAFNDIKTESEAEKMHIEFAHDNKIYDIENEIDVITHKKKIQWNTFRIKGYKTKTEQLLEKVDDLVNAINSLKEKREGLDKDKLIKD